MYRYCVQLSMEMRMICIKRIFFLPASLALSGGVCVGYKATEPEGETCRMTVTIYHNPRCSKSRETLKLLQDRGVEPRVIEYLRTPPDAATLEQILSLLGKEPRDLMRKKEAEYKELGLYDGGKSRADLIAAMVEAPKLIERPIVLANGKAAIGRPPEAVLEIL